MQLGHLMRSAGAGAVIYLVMAACAAAEHAADTSSSSGGDGTSSSGAVSDVFAEAADPVPEAHAEPLAPDVATEACNKSYAAGGAGAAYYYAEHSYPGASLAELASSVTVIMPALANVPGYANQQYLGAHVKDGSVAYFCGGVADSGKSIMFVRRR